MAQIFEYLLFTDIFDMKIVSKEIHRVNALFPIDSIRLDKFYLILERE